MLAELNYDIPKVERGYAGKTLYINLSDSKVKEVPVTDAMKKVFTGGKGFDLWMMWTTMPKRPVKWDEPENAICIGTGPLCGTTTYPGAGKSIVTAISPLTGIPIDSNVGGYFGPFLKFSGFDALELQGKAKKDVVIFIDGDAGRITIEEDWGLPEESHLLGAELTKRYAPGEEGYKDVSVVSAGPGSDNTYWGCLNFSYYDVKRKVVRYKQAGRGGIGTVFRNKRIRALVCKKSGIHSLSNEPANPELLKEVASAHTKEILTLDSKQNEMRVLGTTHITPIMNEFDLLPTKNYQYGAHEEAGKLHADVFRKYFDPGYDGCWRGCSIACAHGVRDFKLKTGPFAGEKVFVDGPEYETVAGCGSNMGIFDPEAVIEFNFYCDTYGIDTISFGTGMAFVMECYGRGLINKKHTGGLDLGFGQFGNAAEVLHQMARGEGFGMIAGRGIRNMKKHFAKEFGADAVLMEDIGMESKGLEFSEYMTKESLAQQGGYGLTLKGSQHDEAWLIFLDMVHNYMPTFEDKAEALHWFPMWRTWFGLNGLCKLPWNDVVPADNKQTKEPAKVPQHLEWYAKFFEAVTGRKSVPGDLINDSERVYNFQRIFNLRQGHGKRGDDWIPYRAMGPVTVEEYESRAERYDTQMKEKIGVDPEGKTTEEKIAITRKYREEQYETLKDSVYPRRGWTLDGVPTLEKVKELGIDFPDVVALLEKNQ
ncbi:MAG: aldehyde:ferredoxin oxidoreductase [Thermoplasmata archaeon HGW-Thermoplasmata-1]|nr:MAG: aldehyde:ferredoxin oxidoreductase [Thermoplasmata archaeon HGW-Thermoplasmata-1]